MTAIQRLFEQCEKIATRHIDTQHPQQWWDDFKETIVKARIEYAAMSDRMKLFLSLLLILTASVASAQHRTIVTESDNLWSAEAAVLGKQLFFDKRFSSNQQVACATCHDPQRAFTDGRSRAVGVTGIPGHRNAPTLLNAGYQRLLMHDGRFEFLAGQAAFPVLDAGEMGLTEPELVRRLNAIPGYVESFKEVYRRAPNVNDFCRAVSSFERTLVLRDVAFLEYVQGNVDAMDDDEIEGSLVFLGVFGQQARDIVLDEGPRYVQRFVASNFARKTGCASCHHHEDLRSGEFIRTGVGLGKIDRGRETISGRAQDIQKFKVPTLLMVGVTGPWFHDGSASSLEAVVEFYSRGGNGDTLADRRIRPLNLTSEDKSLLVQFLTTALSGTYPDIQTMALP